MFDFKLTPETELTPQRPQEKDYDLVIIGGGAAGLSAAIYTARDEIKTLILDKITVGGLAATTELIENYAGFPEGINGPELMQRFRQQAERFGAEIVEFEEVSQLESLPEGGFVVQTGAGLRYRARAVLVATGSQPRKLGIPGEKELYGRGLSYCATCDGPLFRGKDVIIIGAGNSGLQEGSHLLNLARNITILEFLPTSKAEKILQDRMFGHERVSALFNHAVTAILGTQRVTGVRVTDRVTGEEKTLLADGVFIYIGYKPDTEFLTGRVELDPIGYVKTDTLMHTSVPGIFAAGDVRANNVAQVAVAVGDGAKAAIAIREYLLNLEAGKR